MVEYKGCPRCGGDLITDRDMDGLYRQCLLCSYRREGVASAVSAVSSSPEYNDTSHTRFKIIEALYWNKNRNIERIPASYESLSAKLRSSGNVKHLKKGLEELSGDSYLSITTVEGKSKVLLKPKGAAFYENWIKNGDKVQSDDNGSKPQSDTETEETVETLEELAVSGIKS